jgi:stringent starvation protein B
MADIPTKPYLLRAIYEWCTDNGYTPYLASAVDARTLVPREFVKNGEIVLNISFTATSGLKMGNDFVEFNARFGGVSRGISVPVDNVVAIYARENGQGMAFEVARPSESEGEEPTDGESRGNAPTLSAVPAPVSDESGTSSGPDGDDEPPKKGKRPALTRIK